MSEVTEPPKFEFPTDSFLHNDGHKGPQKLNISALETVRPSAEKLYVRDRTETVKKSLDKMKRSRFSQCQGIAANLLDRFDGFSSENGQRILDAGNQTIEVDQIGDVMSAFSARIHEGKRIYAGRDVASMLDVEDEIRRVPYSEINNYPGESVIAKKDDGRETVILRTETPGVRVGFEFAKFGRFGREEVSNNVKFAVFVDTSNKDSEIKIDQYRTEIADWINTKEEVRKTLTKMAEEYNPANNWREKNNPTIHAIYALMGDLQKAFVRAKRNGEDIAWVRNISRVPVVAPFLTAFGTQVTIDGDDPNGPKKTAKIDKGSALNTVFQDLSTKYKDRVPHVSGYKEFGGENALKTLLIEERGAVNRDQGIVLETKIPGVRLMIDSLSSPDPQLLIKI